MEHIPNDFGQPLFSRYQDSEFADDPISAKGLNYIIKNTLGPEYSSHSFRVSFISRSKVIGCSNEQIQRQTKHKSSSMISRYTQYLDCYENNAAEHLGL